MLQHESDAQAYRTGGEQRGGTPHSRRQTGRILLIAGDVLVVAAFLIPWVQLTSSSSDIPRQEYSPFAFAWESASHGAFLPTTLVVLPIAAILASTILLIAWSASARRRGLLAYISILLALGNLLVSIVLVLELPFPLSFSWPYYNTTFELGTWVAMGGFLVVAVGSSLLGF